MNREQDVITESERIKKLEQRLNEAEEELMILIRGSRVHYFLMFPTIQFSCSFTCK